ncbi:MAG TPA: pyrroline-5-carboxylate reductase [Verrucomicrobiales bacterium]|nr:pyrroline-5-carboxylate reductase [Verrucomicrobiales bacterium]
MPETLSIGFIGAGKMATALARGLIAQGLTTPDRLCASDVFEPAREAFARETGGKGLAGNSEVVRQAQIVFLAVKPAQVREALVAVRDVWTPQNLLVSIAAGISIEQLQSALKPDARVVRVMPNTPALVGASASAFACGPACRTDDAALVQKLLGAVGLACEVKENLLDAVTGLSGSGPAYAYQFIEALSDGGVAAGLPRDLATRLAAQTVLGAARMVLETGQHPGALKDMVTSPGGTTIEGVHELEKGGLRAAVMNAVRAASEKSKALGR